MENPIKMDDLGVPLFLETPIYIYHKHGTVYGILTYGLVNLYGKGNVNRPYIESGGKCTHAEIQHVT